MTGGAGRAAPRPALGILLIVVAASCFATMDTTLRYMGAFMGVVVLLFARYAVHTAVMTVWLLVQGDKTFRTANPRFQVLRGLLLLTSSALAFTALKHMPVAEFTAIVMLTPLLVTLVSAWLLHERVNALRWALVFGGFAGALIVIRPGSGLFGWAVLLPLIAAVCNAAFQVLTGKLGPHESPHTTNFYTGLTGVTVMAPILWWSADDIVPTLAAAPPLQLALIAAIGVLGTAGHLLLIMALGVARTATLMPFLYTQIAVAALMGWIVFQAAPDFWGWVGMAVIAVCGAASAWLNVREAARTREVSAVEADTLAD